MKKLFLLTIFSLFTIIFPTQIKAASSTPSATPTDLQDKIKTLVKENLDNTESLLQKEITQKSLLGFTGKVKSVGSKSITLETETDLLQVSIATSTSITKAGSEIKTSSIALADNLLVIGSKTKEDVLEAKVINVLPPVDLTTQVITKANIATFKNIDLKKKTFKLIINNEESDFTLSKKSTVKLEDFKDGDTIFAITKKYQGKLSLSRAKKI